MTQLKKVATAKNNAMSTLSRCTRRELQFGISLSNTTRHPVSEIGVPDRQLVDVAAISICGGVPLAAPGTKNRQARIALDSQGFGGGLSREVTE